MSFCEQQACWGSIPMAPELGDQTCAHVYYGRHIHLRKPTAST